MVGLSIHLPALAAASAYAFVAIKRKKLIYKSSKTCNAAYLERRLAIPCPGRS